MPPPDDQSAVVEFLEHPSTHGGAPVQRIDTHTAIVFLAGARAWKLKRAVRFDYVDFSTAARRRACCEAEVRLNRRTAPMLYQGVVPVTRDAAGGLAIGGSGAAVDWLVEMRRFPQEALLDRQAARGELDLALMLPLGRTVAAFHLAAQRRSEYGGAASLEWVIRGNAAGFAEFGAGILDADAVARLTAAALSALDRHGTLLERRRSDGYVRQCHGDLHLGNIVLVDDRPTLFDAVEFNDAIACGDVLYDLAFLLMDLWHRRLPRHASAVWNAYLGTTADLDGLALMPLFLSCRAAIRAKTSATTVRVQDGRGRASGLEEAACAYLALAETLLRPVPATIVATGGLSGSGKSTLAAELAPFIGAPPGAVVLRSDEIRKRLCGVPALERLGPAGYTTEVSVRVYATLAQQAGAIARAGHGVIVDAVYANPGDRRSLERVAADARVPFAGLWLEAPPETLLERVERRRLDPSDADADVVRRQLAQDLGAVSWRRIDATPDVDRVLHQALHALADSSVPPRDFSDAPRRAPVPPATVSGSGRGT